LSKQVLVEVLQEKSIQEKDVAAVVDEEGPTWMTPITNYLKEGILPDDRKEADYVIREIHEGSCSMHAGPRSVVAKAMRSGYYWPTMHRDTRDVIRKCKDCQVHRPVPRNPQQPLTPITTPWPFYKWELTLLWIEAKAVATISGSHVKKFVWDNI
ncbi:reverse transcriptase domain-containing protein, partial [Tanacetum coccineum]